MKRFSSLTLVLGSVFAATAAHAITVEQALAQFDSKIRDYNLVSFGNVTMTGGMDTEAGIAVQGNLSINGNWSIGAHPGEFDTNSNPAVFLNGSLTISSGSTVRLESGYSSMANIGSGWSWNAAQDLLTKSGNGDFSTVNSPSPKADLNPKSNAAPAGWDWSTLKSDLLSLSTTFNAFANNGVVAVNSSNQTLEFKASAGATGPLVVDLDLNQLNGNLYNGQMFSNVNFIMGANTNYIVNVLNAGSSENFFGSGINFNGSAYADRILWNFVDATPSSAATALHLGNGGEFSGSVLAATYNVSNYNSTIINGQVVANCFDLSSNELHFAGFRTPEVPEPKTYGVIGAAACLGVLAVRSRRSRA